MVEHAAHWTDRVIPYVPVRQWVLTVPWPRRYLLARRPELAKGALHVALDAIFGWYRDRGQSSGVPNGQTGAVTVIQRAGSSANLNLHFHSLVVDGVYHRDEKSGHLWFHHVSAPTSEDVASLVATIADRVENWLAKKGFGREEAAPEQDPEDVQALFQAASMEGRSVLRRSPRRRGRGPRIERELPPRCAVHEGYNLHAGTEVPARDRVGLERLCRYISRPPLARSRLEEREDGSLVLRLKQPWSDGTTEIQFTKLEFMERLCALIPPPRSNQVLYHGILGARAAWRSEVVPLGPESHPSHDHGQKLIRVENASKTPRWLAWAELLRRTFEVDGWACPKCGGRLVLRTVVIRPPATLKILAGLARSSQGPP